ncbi:MAG: GNAT family N-acetyltransferase [Mycobacteriales bacterium]|jgi:putative acetyltransferase
MLIRREAPADVAAVRDLTTVAFRRPGSPPDAVPVETPLLDALRACDQWIPALSLVADEAGAVVGHVVCTGAWVAGTPVLALGPISVRPDRQRQGVGHALIHTVLGAADACEAPLVALLGSPHYYPRFGFRRGLDLGIVPPDPAWSEAFQVRTLSVYDPSLRGDFAYAAPFNEL